MNNALEIYLEGIVLCIEISTLLNFWIDKYVKQEIKSTRTTVQQMLLKHARNLQILGSTWPRNGICKGKFGIMVVGFTFRGSYYTPRNYKLMNTFSKLFYPFLFFEMVSFSKINM